MNARTLTAALTCVAALSACVVKPASREVSLKPGSVLQVHRRVRDPVPRVPREGHLRGHVRLDTDGGRRFGLSLRDFRYLDIGLFLRRYPNVQESQIQIARMRFADDPTPVEPAAYVPPPSPAPEAGADAQP